MKNRKGFTIVELVIVIAVIAILAAVLIPTFSGVVQKANESASLQTATSAMKTVLAQSSAATIADGSYFIVGDKAGANYIYMYDNSKMGTENLKKKTASENILYGKTVSDTTDKLNCIILPIDDATQTPDTSDETLQILSDILGQTVTGSNIVSVPATDAPGSIPTNAKYYVNIDLDTDAEVSFYVGIITNVDFTKGTVVFTYSK